MINYDAIGIDLTNMKEETIIGRKHKMGNNN